MNINNDNINNDNINIILNKYIVLVNDICNKKNYHENVKHLLYLIVPSFIIRYGLNNERGVINCFENTDIILSNKKDERVVAFFDRRIIYKENEYLIKNYVVINNFNNVNYIDLLDSIIHEFNHVINSYNNEMILKDKFIYLRTGISTIKYSISDINTPIERSKDAILEEIINTKQTEEIMDILIGLKKYNIENTELSNILGSLNREINSSTYKSNAYYYQSYICKQLMQNRTFISTIEKLRYDGNIEYIDEWFDNIVGEKGKYNKLYTLLNEIMELEIKYNKASVLKNYKLSRIKEKSKSLLTIIDDFNNNCILN